MNIEQIKKDWEKHCEEYGFQAVFEQYQEITNHNGIWFKIEKETFGSYNKSCIYINLTTKSLSLDTSNYKEIKLFITFYEKLMEQDNEQ